VRKIQERGVESEYERERERERPDTSNWSSVIKIDYKFLKNTTKIPLMLKHTLPKFQSQLSETSKRLQINNVCSYT